MAKIMPSLRAEESFGFVRNFLDRIDARERCRTSSILRCNLILLQFSIRHFISPRPQRLLWKPNGIHAQRHPAAQALRRLHERLRRPQRPEAAGKIFQCRLTEIAVGIVSEERTIDCAVLKTFEDLLRLLKLRRCGRISRREQQGSDPTGDSAGGTGCILIGEHDYGCAVVREDYVLGCEARDFAAM